MTTTPRHLADQLRQVADQLSADPSADTLATISDTITAMQGEISSMAIAAKPTAAALSELAATVDVLKVRRVTRETAAESVKAARIQHAAAVAAEREIHDERIRLMCAAIRGHATITDIATAGGVSRQRVYDALDGTHPANCACASDNG